METKITVNGRDGIVQAFENEVQVGQIDFIFNGESLSIEHTRTFGGHEGKGVASTLVQAVTEYAQGNGMKIIPVCSYAQAWYQRHPQHNGILREGGES